MNSCEKGKRGERETSAYLRSLGYSEARRGQQYRGGGDSPDIVGVPGLHIENKYTQRLALYDAVDQSTRDAADGCLPIVLHQFDRRRKGARGERLVIMRADDFFTLYRKAHDTDTD